MTPAVIFDIDGTLVDTNYQHALAWFRAFRQHDVIVPVWVIHRAIGEAAQNYVLLSLLDTLNAVRRTVTWGRLRADRERPASDHHSFAEHEAIVDAIDDRDRNRARDAMRAHLLNVERKLLAS